MGAGASGVLKIVLAITVFKKIATNLARSVFFAKKTVLQVLLIAPAQTLFPIPEEAILRRENILRSELPAACPEAACIIDLTGNTAAYPPAYKENRNCPVFIAEVTGTRDGWPDHFIRFNGWPGFLDRPLWEACCPDEAIRKKAEELAACFGRKLEWVPDIPGFLTARVLACIINEAYFALEEKVSGKKETDTAMQLGTNYPMGPFAWCEKIGRARVFKLLQAMAVTEKRYTPCTLLEKEAIHGPDSEY